MNLNCNFLSRFKTTIAGMDFYAEHHSNNYDEYLSSLKAAQQATASPELSAVLIYLDMSQPDGNSAYQLDDASNELLDELCEDAGLDREPWINETMGSYDRINNRVNAVDMGAVFPDWSMRFIWSADKSKGTVDFALSLVRGAVELLLKAQELPEFKATEDQEDEGDYEPVKARRVQALFQAGLWACQDAANPFPTPLTDLYSRINKALGIEAHNV
ncbi:hypothetical protein LC612_30850 [Nostoc sp. CHAB 5834]|nr:hypothetical protein [Nostoc sp. CHAB 5834]